MSSIGTKQNSQWLPFHLFRECWRGLHSCFYISPALCTRITFLLQDKSNLHYSISSFCHHYSTLHRNVIEFYIEKYATVFYIEKNATGILYGKKCYSTLHRENVTAVNICKITRSILIEDMLQSAPT